jgi:hypothetical protein
MSAKQERKVAFNSQSFDSSIYVRV